MSQQKYKPKTLHTQHLDAGQVYEILKPLLVRLRPTALFEAMEAYVEAGILTERQVETIIHKLSATDHGKGMTDGR